VATPWLVVTVASVAGRAILQGMRIGVALVLAVASAACGGPEQAMIEAHPGPARALAVPGLVNVELFCDLGQIGGVVGPSAPSPQQSAEAYAISQGWAYSGIEEQGNGERFLFVFSLDGFPTAEVVVGRSDESPGAQLVEDDEGWRVWAVQSCQ